MARILENTLKKRVLIFVFVILLCFLSGVMYMFYMSYQINTHIRELFGISIFLKDMRSEMGQFERDLDAYLSSKSSDSFVAYLDGYTALNERMDTLAEDSEKTLQMRNIGYLLESYLELSESAIDYKRARNTEQYIAAYTRMMTIGGYIEEKATVMERLDFEGNLERYMAMADQIGSLQRLLLWVMLLLMLLGGVFVFSFSTDVTQPIVELSARAEQISRGTYQKGFLHRGRFKEAEVLQDAFDEMAGSIENYVEELHDKVDTENKLRVSEIEKLRIQNSLNQAELRALQAQINPHFLFNTLNAGVQLAILEDADRTGQFLEDLSKLFRYTLQSLNNQVTLRSEFENARHYAELMHVRFGSDVQMDFFCAAEAESTQMPPLILQPLIENAIIHGFGARTVSGHIHIRAEVLHAEGRASDIHICVRDNGQGISPEALIRMNTGVFNSTSGGSGHTTGLGLQNVADRLNVFFKGRCHMRFESERGVYTQVTLVLPMEEAHA